MKMRIVYTLFVLLIAVLLLASCAQEDTTAVTTEVPSSSSTAETTGDLYYPTPEGTSPFDGILDNCKEITRHYSGSGEVLSLTDPALLNTFFTMLNNCQYTACTLEIVEHTKTQDEIMKYQYIAYWTDFEDGSLLRWFYVDAENGYIYDVCRL